MTSCNRLDYLLLLALIPFLSQWQTSLADYYKAKCNNLTEDGKEQHKIPRFLQDFRVLSEKTVMESEKDSIETVLHERLWYSSIFRQAMRYEESSDKSTWLYLDEVNNDCLYKESRQTCEDLPQTCSIRASEFMSDNRRLTLGSYLSILNWPNPSKKEVSLGEASVRGIPSFGYATCNYDQSSDVSTLSLWQFVNPQAFSNMDRTSANLLMAHHRKYRDEELIVDERIDYTDYKQLKSSDIPNGLQIGENQCGHIQGSFRSVKPPSPSFRHGFVSEMDITGPQQVRSNQRYTSYTEYNYMSQILFTVSYMPVPGENEKETIVSIYDFLTDHYFRYSLTNGNCEVSPSFNYDGSPVMPTPETYWLFTTVQKPSYLGVYYNRGIPCNTWLFEYPEGGPGFDLDTTVTLFLATPSWLAVQGFPQNMFFPVQKISRTNGGNIFESYYEYKDNPGYHIPDLFTCFDKDDVVTGKITLEKTNYYKTIAHREIHFEYEFRHFIQKITGIKSHIRISKIAAAPSNTNTDETDVVFMILGKFVNINSTVTIAYKTDPVTSQQAADRINKAVDKGDAKFLLDNKSVTLHLKKGSFSVVKNADHFENVDNPEQKQSSGGGYSQLTLAAVSITLLFVCLALSVLAVFIYKRRTEGQTVLPSFRLQNLSSGK
ncbi:hypothetical protein RRG08_009053 [Elysia crispata]|uniref:LolA-like domain-containing protein n=2 Tax=Elysia crispata TaxID=231223 RepID=A0AAE1ABF0_9GAST|nr:hypothetical protein RRG08_009053 [Elysia crispata]